MQENRIVRVGDKYFKNSQTLRDYRASQCACCRPDGRKIKVNIISGFLGSGKTTMLNYLLSRTCKKRLDVLIREYGHVSVDDKLLRGVAKDCLHIFSGISLHDDPQLMLHDYLHRLASEKASSQMDNLLIEASGLDRPANLVSLFMLGNMPGLYQLGSVITVVDAKYGMLNLDEYEVAVEQVATADVIVINKIDLASAPEVEQLRRRLKGINGMARVLTAEFGRVEPDKVLDTVLYQQLKEMEPAGECEAMDKIKTITLSTDRAMSKERVNAWIDDLFTKYGKQILRGKGFLKFSGDNNRYEFQSVRESFHSYSTGLWPLEEDPHSVIVLIGSSGLPVEEIQQSFFACTANE